MGVAGKKGKRFWGSPKSKRCWIPKDKLVFQNQSELRRPRRMSRSLASCSSCQLPRATALASSDQKAGLPHPTHVPSHPISPTFTEARDGATRGKQDGTTLAVLVTQPLRRARFQELPPHVSRHERHSARDGPGPASPPASSHRAASLPLACFVPLTALSRQNLYIQ